MAVPKVGSLVDSRVGRWEYRTAGLMVGLMAGLWVALKVDQSVELTVVYSVDQLVD